MTVPDPAEFRRALSEPLQALLETLVREADRRKLAVYAVGGPVRDWLLGRPLADLDLVVEDGDAASLAEAAAPEGARVTRHDRFGTVRLQTPEAELDLAGARRESYAHPGALPKVEPGDLDDDLHRRDFSINALALSLSRRAMAQRPSLVDPEDGVRDLAERRLRVLHGRSFHDDPTRALRAARLAPRLDFLLTRGSRSALRDALRDGAFGRVSGDRLRREFIKTIDDARLGVDVSRPLRLLSDWHVLTALEPGLELSRAAAAPLRRLGRSVQTPPWRPGRWRPWVSALELWLAPLSPGLRGRALQRFSVRGEAGERIRAFPKARDGWLRALSRARGRGAIDAVLAAVSEDDLHALHAAAEPTARRRIARYASEDRMQRLPVTGDDLLKLGLRGPALGRALVRVRTAFLDGSVGTRDEAMALAREIARRSASRRRSTPRKKPDG